MVVRAVFSFLFFFLIVNFSVMEFSKRTTKRKPQRQGITLNLQMQATAWFIARFVTVLGQRRAGATGGATLFLG